MRRTPLLLAALAVLGVLPAKAQRFEVPPAPYFTLQLADAAAKGMCLEANVLGEHSVLLGATFLDRCQSVTGQAWSALAVGNGRFRLFTEFQGPERCLTVNAGETEALPLGVPYMAACNDQSPIFEALAGPSEQYFQLRAAIEGEQVCLGSHPSYGADDAYVPVLAAECAATTDQLWMAVEGRLSGGVPVAITEDEREVASLQAPFGEAKPAECLWNDGTSDRPEYFPCLLERAADGRRFVVTGRSQSHAFEVEPDEPDAAEGFLRVGKTTLRLGRFERRADDRSCWLNSRSGERLCIW